MKVNIIGPFPPPIGGISIHVLRLLQYLTKEETIDLKGFDDSRLKVSLIRRIYHFLRRKRINRKQLDNIKKYENNFNITEVEKFKKLFFRFLFSPPQKARIIHYHSLSWKYWEHRALLTLLNVINSRNKIILTIHSLRDEYSNLSWRERIYVKFSLKHSSYTIVTNQVIKDKIASWGAPREKIDIIPAYLPPKEDRRDFEEIPKEVWNFIEKHHPVISANASMIKFYQNQDLYGIDMCIELCSKLKRIFPNIGFVFSLPQIRIHKYFQELLLSIEEKSITDNFLFITKAYQFYPILMKSDVFVRPTNSDGDALSLKESLNFKIPAVASDVVARPAGTILFKNRDVNDLHEKIKDILVNYNEYKKRIEGVDLEDNAEKIMEIYRRIAG